MICSELEYAAVVWAPHRKKDIRKMQRIATKMVPELKDLAMKKKFKRWAYQYQ